jgi:hypothetical protein
MGGTYYIDVVGSPFNWIYLGGVYLDTHDRLCVGIRV